MTREKLLLDKILNVLGVEDININSLGLLEGYINEALSPSPQVTDEKRKAALDKLKKVDEWLDLFTIETRAPVPHKRTVQKLLRDAMVSLYDSHPPEIVDCGGPYCVRCCDHRCDHVKSVLQQPDKTVEETTIMEGIGRIPKSWTDAKSSAAPDWACRPGCVANEALKEHLDHCQPRNDKTVETLKGVRDAIKSERDLIFYAMTRGDNYDIGLAKERMTYHLSALDKIIGEG